MKAISTIFVLLSSINLLATEVEIKITGVEEEDSTIYVAVYDKEADWPAGEPFRGFMTPATSPVTITQVDLPAGTYAVSVFQDLNGNGEMDYNALRMPKEPWGVSNDAPARFGPPKFKKMSFEVGSEPITIEFGLK